MSIPLDEKIFRNTRGVDLSSAGPVPGIDDIESYDWRDLVLQAEALQVPRRWQSGARELALNTLDQRDGRILIHFSHTGARLESQRADNTYASRLFTTVAFSTPVSF